MSDIKKKKKDFKPLPIHWQPDKVLDQLFNDEVSSTSSQELEELKNSLNPVAFSGSYNDLTDIPTNSDGSYNDTEIKAELAEVKEKVDSIDLSEYVKKSDIEEATSDEILAIYNS